MTPEECASFGVRHLPVSWGVFYRDELAAVFRAEPLHNGWLAVHADARRHTLTPRVVQACARSFAAQLLEQGARGLLCKIPNANRAAIRLAKAAGFTPCQQTSTETILIKHNGQPIR